MVCKYLIYPSKLMHLNCEWLVGVLGLFCTIKKCVQEDNKTRRD